MDETIKNCGPLVPYPFGRIAVLVAFALIPPLILSSPVSAVQCSDHWLSGQGLPGVNGKIKVLTVYDNQLVAGGDFTQAGGISANQIARWDGTTWHPFGSGMTDDFSQTYEYVCALTVYNGELFAGGLFYRAGGIKSRSLARWNGTTWNSFGNLYTSYERPPYVYALLNYNGQLIVAGNFASPASNIACWNGTVWNGLSSGVYYNQFNSAVVCSLAGYNGDLVAGGCFLTAGGVTVNHIARWDGTSWRALGSGIGDGYFPYVYAMTAYNGELIAGGYFATAGGVAVNNIARWNGSTWQSLGTGINGIVYALIVYNGELIAGGDFTTAGGVSVSGVAKWNGTTWKALGDGIGGFPRPEAYALTVYNGELIVGGKFTTAGGIASAYLARWGVENGDLTCDDKVDLADFSLLAVWWLDTCDAPDWCDAADFNKDHAVNGLDLLTIADRWLTGF